MRPRPLYGALIFVFLLLGLASRSSAAQTLPGWLQEYSGDTLWAMLVFFGIAFLLASQALARIALLALGFAFLIEFSQLYQAPWINDIRSNRFAALLLGRGFLWTDLICYSVGVVLAAGIDWLLTKRRPPATAAA